MAVEHILARARRAGPGCGAATVIAVDGPSGSGKTTLARDLAARARAQLVHMDDLYPGWGGMREGGDRLGRILSTLAAGREATYRTWDWHAGAPGAARTLAPGGTIVVEGVGAVREAHAHLLSTIVAVREPDADRRMRRAVARDGPDQRPHLQEWMAQEAPLHAEEGLYQRADVLVDGDGRLVEGQQWT